MSVTMIMILSDAVLNNKFNIPIQRIFQLKHQFFFFKILQIPNTKCNAVLYLKQQQQRIRKCNAKRSGKGDTAQIGFNTMKISLKISLKIFLEISLKISKQLLHNYITNSTYDGTFLNLPYISYIVVVFGCDFCK